MCVCVFVCVHVTQALRELFTALAPAASEHAIPIGPAPAPASRACVHARAPAASEHATPIGPALAPASRACVHDRAPAASEHAKPIGPALAPAPRARARGTSPPPAKGKRRRLNCATAKPTVAPCAPLSIPDAAIRAKALKNLRSIINISTSMQALIDALEQGTLEQCVTTDLEQLIPHADGETPAELWGFPTPYGHNIAVSGHSTESSLPP